MSLSFTRHKLTLTAIIALAVFFRFFRLDTLPPGFQFDQAFYVFDALRLLQGQFYIFFAAPGGTEPLYVYLATVGVALFGDTALGLKLTSAIVSSLTIPLVYAMARSLFQSARIGLLAAFFTAISIWSIFYARYGERITLLVLLLTLMFWVFWQALETRRWRYYALTGLFLALGLYTNLASRVFPLALVLLTAHWVWVDRPNTRVYLQGLLLAFIITGIIFLPLGVYFVFHPDQFIGHAAQVSIFVPHGNEEGNVPLALWRNTLQLLGMFFIQGDSGVLRNIPGRPIFDPFLAVLFIPGVIVWLAALFLPRAAERDRRRAVLLGAWLLCAMLLSLVSDDAPNFDRLQPGIPAVMMLPAWGASALWDRLRSPMWRRTALAAFGIIAIASTGLAYRDYFVVLANDPMTYYTFDTDKVETATWVNRNAASQNLFLAPLWYQNGTISLLTRNSPLKSFESRDTIVLPTRATGKDAVFAFPFEQEKKVQTMAARLGDLGKIERLDGSNGGGLVLIYRVPAANLPDPADPLGVLSRGGDFVRAQRTDRARFADQLETVGSTLSPEGPGGRNLTVTLFLRALEPLDQDYTFSLKVRDGRERVWGQEDKWAGDNSYATSAWGAGELVIEKFYPGLSACAPAGEYHVMVEAYNPATLQVLGSPISLGKFEAGPSEGNRPEDLEPDHAADVRLPGGLTLKGYSLPDTLRAGEGFSLSLFWQGVGNGTTAPVTVRLGDARLVESVVKLPGETQGLCSLYDLKLPATMPVGTTGVWVNDSKIAEVQVTR